VKPSAKSIESLLLFVGNIDYRTARGLDRALFQALTTSQWVREHNHLAIVGPTGLVT
jgi:hypothetical protein